MLSATYLWSRVETLRHNCKRSPPNLVLLRTGFALTRRHYCRCGELLPRLFILTGRNRRLFSVALSLGLLQPDVIWYSVSLKPGLSSPLDFPFPSAAIRLPVTDRLYGQGNYCKKFVQKLKTLRKKISPFFYLNKSQARQGLGANRLPYRQNRTRTVNKILKIPIDSHIFPCYTISIGN